MWGAGDVFVASVYLPEDATTMKNVARICLIFLSLFMLGLTPIKAQNFETTLKFCRISQLIAPIFLRGAQIDGASLCEVSGESFCSDVKTLGEGVCRASGESFCNGVTTLGEGVCRAGGESFCNGVTTLGEGVCRASGESFCSGVTSYAEGVCRAGGASFCSGVSSLGEALCRAGGGSLCSSIGNDELGEGFCKAMGGGSNCHGLSISQAICGFTQNCESYDAMGIVVAMAKTCGADVLYFGIP